MPRITLEPQEIKQTQALLGELAERYKTAENPEFQAEAEVYAHELPRRIRREVVGFKLHEPEDALFVLSGFPIDEEKIGPTPAHWKDQDTRERTCEEEMLLVLLGSLLGECIGWKTQQNSLIVHDILPIKAHVQSQIGSGSETVLTWHTEDAFHPYRGDYICMACLRNHDEVPTTLAPLSGVELEPAHLDLLFEPHYTIRPDNSHKKSQGTGQEGDSYEGIEKMEEAPEKIAVLFGDRQAPYMRLDPYFMDPVLDRPDAQEALDALVKALDAQLGDVVLRPGDICMIDNFQAVHGRKAFKARFDGTDRWMKRINVTRDLRKSRDVRQGAADRVLV